MWDRHRRCRRRHSCQRHFKYTGWICISMLFINFKVTYSHNFIWLNNVYMQTGLFNKLFLFVTQNEAAATTTTTVAAAAGVAVAITTI